MAYNKLTDKSAGYISIKHNDLLQSLIDAHKPPVTKRALLEYIIEKEAKETN